MWDVSDTGLTSRLPSRCIPSVRQAPWAASAVVPAAVAHEQDPALQQRGILRDRQQLPGWGSREALLMHEDVTNHALPSVSQRLPSVSL